MNEIRNKKVAKAAMQQHGAADFILSINVNSDELPFEIINKHSGAVSRYHSSLSMFNLGYEQYNGGTTLRDILDNNGSIIIDNTLAPSMQKFCQKLINVCKNINQYNYDYFTQSNNTLDNKCRKLRVEEKARIANIPPLSLNAINDNKQTSFYNG